MLTCANGRRMHALHEAAADADASAAVTAVHTIRRAQDRVPLNDGYQRVAKRRCCKRTVQPVGHWNIVRSGRTVDNVNSEQL